MDRNSAADWTAVLVEHQAQIDFLRSHPPADSTWGNDSTPRWIDVDLVLQNEGQAAIASGMFGGPNAFVSDDEATQLEWAVSWVERLYDQARTLDVYRANAGLLELKWKVYLVTGRVPSDDDALSLYRRLQTLESYLRFGEEEVRRRRWTPFDRPAVQPELKDGPNGPEITLPPLSRAPVRSPMLADRDGLPSVDDFGPGRDESAGQSKLRSVVAARDHGDEKAIGAGTPGSIFNKLRDGKGPRQSLASLAGGPGRRVDNNRYAHGKRVPGTGDGLPSGPANPAKAKSTTPGQAPQPKDNTKDSQGTVREQGRPDPKPTDSSTGPKGGTGGGGGGTGGTPTSPQNPNPPSAPGGGPAPTDGGSSGGSTPTQPTTAGGGSSGSGGSTGGSSGGGGGSTGGTSGGGTSPSGRSGSGGKGGGGSQPKPDPPKPEQDPNKTDKGKSQPKAPTKDPPPDPKKHGNSNPNPEDSGSGSGGPRASGGQNENPNPEDGGGAGGPRAGAASRERPGDDDSSGIYYRRRGPGGGLGGPRAYDAYPDPESSGGVGPKARYERPNPEDTGSPHGPSARTAISWSSATRNRMV